MGVLETTKTVKDAAASIRAASGAKKNAALLSIADALLKNVGSIITANLKDLKTAAENKKDAAFIDRLTLDESRIQKMADGVLAIAALPDPVNETVEEFTLKNGLQVKKVRAPLGVVGIIFEARPNVSSDATALCLKSGNGVVLRPSREAIESVRAIVTVIKTAVKASGLNPDIVALIDGLSRADTQEMLACAENIDVIIPRGGEGLKKFVLENAKMPVLASSGGNCHLYIAETADFNMAKSILINAKTQRCGVCNAVETVLFDKGISGEDIALYLSALQENGVEVRGTVEIGSIYKPTKIIEDREFFEEYSALIIKAKIVDGVKEAVDHINKYGTKHSEAIVTKNAAEGEYFTQNVDCACAYVNASTRFTDGFELGLGAEMGISTQKLHARGPIGLRELTSVRYILLGNGQVRN